MKKSSNRKILIVLGMIVLIVVLGFILRKKNYLEAPFPDKNSPKGQKIEQAESQSQTEEKKSITSYKNGSYKYSINYPDGWYMNNDDSESKMEKSFNDSGQELQSGGQTFWSNYPDINKYTPDNKPDDFKILSLAVYKDSSPSINEFAKKIGASDFSTEQDVQGKNISGKEYMGPSLSGDDILITTIFQENDLFYVFKPAFLRNDGVAADDMEGIVRSIEAL